MSPSTLSCTLSSLDVVELKGHAYATSDASQYTLLFPVYNDGKGLHSIVNEIVNKTPDRDKSAKKADIDYKEAILILLPFHFPRAKKVHL